MSRSPTSTGHAQDEIIGAIGVSGGEVDQDGAVAQAGVVALGATA